MDVESLLATLDLPQEAKDAFLRGRNASRAAYRARVSATPPRGNGPPEASRAPLSLPPPHIRVPPDYTDPQAVYDRVKAARAANGHRDVGGLPWWAFVVAERCLSGGYLDEIKRLPKHLSVAVLKAVSWQRREDARASVAALGCVFAWLGWRNPRRVQRSTNIGGICQQVLRALTRRENGRTYSLSSVAHRSHRLGAVGRAEEREAGFLEGLAQAGALRWWTPCAALVPGWMKGSGYAFAVYRVPSATDPSDTLPVDVPF